MKRVCGATISEVNPATGQGESPAKSSVSISAQRVAASGVSGPTVGVSVGTSTAASAGSSRSTLLKSSAPEIGLDFGAMASGRRR